MLLVWRQEGICDIISCLLPCDNKIRIINAVLWPGGLSFKCIPTLYPFLFIRQEGKSSYIIHISSSVRFCSKFLVS